MNGYSDRDLSTTNDYHLPARRRNRSAEDVEEASPASYSKRYFGIVRGSGVLRLLAIELECLL